MNEELIQELINILSNAKIISELNERTTLSDNNSFLAINLGTDDAQKIRVALLRGSLGQYNASTNTPTLADATGLAGDTYEVSTAGTRDFGSGAISMLARDVIYHTGTRWTKVTKTQISDIQGLQTALDVRASISNSDEFYIDENGELRLNLSTYRQVEIFLTGSSQTITLDFEPTFIYSVSVNGLPLIQNDFVYTSPDQLEILGTLENNDTIEIIYDFFINPPTAPE